MAAEHAAKQSAEGQALRRGLEAITTHMEALSLTTKRTWTAAQRHTAAIGCAVKKLSALVGDIRKLFLL
jgi:hypothetical protein